MCKRKQTIYHLNAFVLVIVFISIITITALSIFPRTVLEFENDKYEVINKEVKAGDLVYYRIKQYKKYDVVGHIDKQLIDTYIYNYETVSGSLDKGYIDNIVSLKIPDYAEPGIYYIKITFIYKLNMFNTITQVQTTENFNIID
jgi:hypothetical protein